MEHRSLNFGQSILIKINKFELKNFFRAQAETLASRVVSSDSATKNTRQEPCTSPSTPEK